MSKCIRIAADTQLAYNVPIRVMGARLVSDVETVANIYDEASSAATAAKKKIALITRNQLDAIEIFSDEAMFPPDGVLFTEGCFVDWTAGEIFLYIKE